MQLDIPNYTLLKKLGAGAFAEVWLAEHRNNRRRVAIKILKASVEAGGDAEALFLREGEVLASFSERNIVTIFDNAKIGEHAYLIMELLSGGSLLDRMQAQGLEVGEAIGHVVQIAAALDAAHKRNIIHRDLKPANIMLRDETTPVLTDFGASKMLQRSTIYGKDGGVVGTPQYMSPEQITGQPLDGRSDLYALGVMFHELLTGRAPFAAASLHEVLALHLHAPLPQLPAELAVLQPILDRLLAKDREQRFRNGAALADALRRCFLDQQALRRLVRFAPSSAWSSQLKALGFQLDSAERDEVRIAQGEFLQQARRVDPPPVEVAPPVLQRAPEALVTPAAPPSNAAGLVVPGAKPIPPSPASWSRLPTVLAASCAVLPVYTLLATTLGLSGEHRLAELMLQAVTVPILVFMAVSARIAWTSGSRAYAWTAGLCLLPASAAVLVALALACTEGVGSGYPVEIIPLTLLLALALGLWLLGLRLRSWWWPMSGLLGLSASLGLAILAFEDDEVLGPTCLVIGVVLSIALWFLLAAGDLIWARLRRASIWIQPRPRWWLGIASAAVLLLPTVVLPFARQLASQRAAFATISGSWYGVSAMGRIKADFEPGGALLLYGTGDGEQQPWVGRWKAEAGLNGYYWDKTLYVHDDEDQYLTLTSFATGYRELSVTGGTSLDDHTLLPLLLKRDESASSTLVPLSRLMRKIVCPEHGSFLLQFDGTGFAQAVNLEPVNDNEISPYDGRWLELTEYQHPGLYLVIRHDPARTSKRPLFFKLASDLNSAELDLGEYPRVQCSVEVVDPAE